MPVTYRKMKKTVHLGDDKATTATVAAAFSYYCHRAESASSEG